MHAHSSENHLQHHRHPSPIRQEADRIEAPIRGRYRPVEFEVEAPRRVYKEFLRFLFGLYLSSTVCMAIGVDSIGTIVLAGLMGGFATSCARSMLSSNELKPRRHH